MEKLSYIFEKEINYRQPIKILPEITKKILITQNYLINFSDIRVSFKCNAIITILQSDI